ncbi:MAG: pyridoxal phosphate-dependent class II aminotransferase [Candidatus Dadabacteria bacterium]|nr:MAG: pyridoxal phosphate-dependent class II aminotransferase [Candidatus Dadabacteria bacterium]
MVSRRPDPWPQDHGGDVWVQPEGARVVDFSASINPYGPPPGLWEELGRVWPRIVHYPDRRCRGLRAALAHRFGLPGEVILPGNGSAELIDLVLRALAPARLVWCPPDFSLYAQFAPAGTALVEVPRQAARGFRVDFGRLAETVQPGDVVVFSNPGNPAGCLEPADEVLRLARRCRERGALVLVDEAFMDFCPEEGVLGRAADGGGILVLRSLTKFYALPGLRVGFLAGPADLVGRIARLQVPWSVNTLAQVAGAHCVGRRAWEEETRAAILGEAERFRERLGRLPGVRPLPSAANYLLVELLPPAPTATAAYEALARQGILVRHCGSFGLGDRYLRIAVRRPEENEELVGALEGILGVRRAAG